MEIPVYPYRTFLVGMLRKFVEILDKQEILYVASGGTLLGSIREKGFISHDYDCDLDILPESRADFFALLACIHASPGLGLNVEYRLPDVVKISPVVSRSVCEVMQFNTTTPNPTIDCFLLKKNEDEEYSIEGDGWPTWTYPKGELLPLRRIYFEDFSMWGPNSHNILDRYYGDWHTPKVDPWPVRGGRNCQST